MLTVKGSATRERILAGAAELIRERGAANVGLDDIRAATSTSKSQLFHYFPDGKSDLLLAVAQREAEQVLADQQPMLGDLADWPTWEAWRRRVIEKYEAQRAGCPLSALFGQLGLANPETQKIIAGLYERWHGYLAAGVAALRDGGEIDADVDVGRAATGILTSVTGGATLLQATDDITYLDVGLREAIDNLRRPGRADGPRG
jgi:AcrR family transcriptional regulator